MECITIECSMRRQSLKLSIVPLPTRRRCCKASCKVETGDKQFLRQQFKAKMQSRVPFSMLAFAIDQCKSQFESVEKAAAHLGLTDVQLHQTVFEPLTPTYMFQMTTVGGVA